MADWVLPDLNSATTEPPTVEGELLRLQSLKSFHVLDTSNAEPYQRFCRLATKLFRTPVAFINLIDLGRYWMLAHEGLLPDTAQCDASTLTDQKKAIREGPRQTAFCAHVIHSRLPVIQVQDLSKDPRSQGYPFVAELGYRFYAAAPLISP